MGISTLGLSEAFLSCPPADTAANDEPKLDVGPLRARADKGDAGAQDTLGILYANGNGVPEDKVQADMWFTLASNGGNEVAPQHLANLEKRMTPEQIAEAKKRASEWKPARPAATATPPPTGVGQPVAPPLSPPASVSSHPQIGPV